MMLQNVGQKVLGLTESGGSHVGFLSPDQLPWCFRMWVRRYWVWQNPVGVMWDVSALTGSCPKMGVLLAKWELTWTPQARFVHFRNASLKVFKLLDQHCKYHVVFCLFVVVLGGGGGGGGGNCGSYYCIKLGLQPCQALNFTEVVSNWNRPPP